MMMLPEAQELRDRVVRGEAITVEDLGYVLHHKGYWFIFSRINCCFAYVVCLGTYWDGKWSMDWSDRHMIGYLAGWTYEQAVELLRQHQTSGGPFDNVHPTKHYCVMWHFPMDTRDVNNEAAYQRLVPLDIYRQFALVAAKADRDTVAKAMKRFDSRPVSKYASAAQKRKLEDSDSPSSVKPKPKPKAKPAPAPAPAPEAKALEGLDDWNIGFKALNERTALTKREEGEAHYNQLQREEERAVRRRARELQREAQEREHTYRRVEPKPLLCCVCGGRVAPIDIALGSIPRHKACNPVTQGADGKNVYPKGYRREDGIWVCPPGHALLRVGAPNTAVPGTDHTLGRRRSHRDESH